jgi:hypothetical protein
MLKSPLKNNNPKSKNRMKRLTITTALQFAFVVTIFAQDFDFEQVRAKSEAAKGQTVVFKGFYLGMPVQDALGLINHYMGLPQTSATPVESSSGNQANDAAGQLFAKALMAPLADMGMTENLDAKKSYSIFKKGNELVIARSALDRPFAVADSNGTVTCIELSKRVQHSLFESADIPTSEFLKTFIDAYDIPSLEPANTTLVANVFGMQQEAGIQTVLRHRNPNGYEVTYSGDILWNSEDAKALTEHSPEGHLTIRTIETARERESNFD